MAVHCGDFACLTDKRSYLQKPQYAGAVHDGRMALTQTAGGGWSALDTEDNVITTIRYRL